jgi:hypothetical protein
MPEYTPFAYKILIVSRSRTVPCELVRALCDARELESAAATLEQRTRAIAATSRLLLACMAAGWRVHELASVLGLRHATASARIAAARRREVPLDGLRVPAPPSRPASPRAILGTPLGQREWLTLREASRHAAVSVHTVRLWRRAGLLPNCHWLTPTMPLYLRADLDRVRAAPRRGKVGVDRAALLTAIRATPGPNSPTPNASSAQPPTAPAVRR